MSATFIRRALFLIASAPLIMLGSTPAQAQLLDTFTFHTAFPFVVGNREVPAGSYAIRRAGDGPSLYVIQGRKSAFFVVNPTSDAPATGASTPEVIFTRYGDTLVMSEVWDPYNSIGVVSSVPFKGAAEARERAGRVAEAIPVSVVIPARSEN